MALKVLIVEDDPTLLGMLRNLVFPLDPRFTPLFASSIEEAEKVFYDHPDIVAIAMDGRIEDGLPRTNEEVWAAPANTLDLVQKYRETFSGPIIALSGKFRQDLLDVGCDYYVKNKYDIHEKLIEVLCLTPYPAHQTSHGKTAL
ncbi:MAG: response regulator [bacterium]|nr:response regulator [bacterium]